MRDHQRRQRAIEELSARKDEEKPEMSDARRRRLDRLAAAGKEFNRTRDRPRMTQSSNATLAVAATQGADKGSMGPQSAKAASDAGVDCAAGSAGSFPLRRVEHHYSSHREPTKRAPRNYRPWHRPPSLRKD